jgi:hypothetical protein
VQWRELSIPGQLPIALFIFLKRQGVEAKEGTAEEALSAASVTEKKIDMKKHSHRLLHYSSLGARE